MSEKVADLKLEKVKRKYNKMNKRKKASYFGSMIDPKSFHPSQIKFYVIMVPILFIMILPLVYIVFTAFKPISELYAYPPKFITFNLTLQNFKSLFEATSQTGIALGRYVFNSVLVSAIVIVLSFALMVVLFFRNMGVFVNIVIYAVAILAILIGLYVLFSLAKIAIMIYIYFGVICFISLLAFFIARNVAIKNAPYIIENTNI